MKSKFAGRCPFCGVSYPAGTNIAKKNGTWGHANCNGATKPTPTTFQQYGREKRSSGMSLAVREAEAVTTKPESKFTPSAYQLAIFRWIVFGQGHAVVEAVAGSGKTTTSVQAVRYLPLAVAYRRSILSENQALAIFDANDFELIRPYEYLMAGLDIGFCAFNKHIARELGVRLPTWCYSATLHSLGLANLSKAFGHPKIDELKRWDYLYEPYPELRSPPNWRDLSEEERAALRMRRTKFRKLVSLTKATLLDPSDRDSLEQLVDYYGLDLAEEFPLMAGILPRVLQESKEQVDLIDFDDMQWLPIILGIPLRKFDFLFIDEAQDLNDNQGQLVIGSIKPNGRIIAVGDSRQSLYGFRGANVDAIDNLVATLDAKILPLSITYRCPASHVAMAKMIVPQIEARENAPQGTIEQIDEELIASRVTQGDMVICRTNAPLVPVAFMLIRKGVKATIRGKDIGKGLADLAEKLATDCRDLSKFFERLDLYRKSEVERLERRKASETQIDALDDRIETLKAVADECSSPKEVPQRVRDIFSDDNGEVVLSSVHKAKGLEAERVWILRPDQMPFPKAKLDWEMQQEMNIKYVAITRSKSALFFVNPRE